MKQILTSISLIALMGSQAAVAAEPATSYPSKPVRAIVGYAPGGGSDIMGRIMAQELTKSFGQQMIVENRAGAAQNVAAEMIARSPADGYTLFMSSAALGINISLYPKLSYHPVKDFAPVALFSISPNLLLTHPSLPPKSVKEFIAFAKQYPGKLNYSSSGSGSTQHLSGEMLKVMTGIGIVHVPYRGTSQAVPALLGGHVQVLWASYPNLKAGVEGGLIRLLANNGLGRSPLLPELPPVADIIPGFDLVSVIGLYARADTPEPIVRKIGDEAIAVMKQADIKPPLAGLGMEPVGEIGEQFAKIIANEIATITKVVEATGIKPK